MEYEMRYPSPVGELTIRANASGVTVLALEEDAHRGQYLSGPASPCVPGEEPEILAKTRQWLDDYFGGKAPDVSGLLLTPSGTTFQEKVWRTLRSIPYGETVTYGALADKLNSSPRAVGSAVGRNPISILIPCHRVVGTDGSLTGYAGGLPAKRTLLALEGVALDRTRDRLARDK